MTAQIFLGVPHVQGKQWFSGEMEVEVRIFWMAFSNCTPTRVNLFCSFHISHRESLLEWAIFLMYIIAPMCIGVGKKKHLRTIPQAYAQNFSLFSLAVFKVFLILVLIIYKQCFLFKCFSLAMPHFIVTMIYLLEFPLPKNIPSVNLCS